ncbi:MAG: cellulose biosynthesis cyclic di-GMP-binding regulatory protein BcsB, partial [Pseudomonadota bacterium]
ALDEIGGFAGLSVTEDCESALELHARGWTSRFVDTPLIWGLQPETFTSLIKQRSRWCSGMIQIFMLKNPIFKPGLTAAQRLSYATSCLYWFFPLMRLTFVFAPLLYIFFDMEIFMSSVAEFFAFTVPYILAAVLLQSFMYGRFRWPWMSEVYEYVQSVHLWKAVVRTVFAPKAPRFNVTPKGFVLDEEKLSSLAPPYFLIFGVLALGLLVALWRIGSGEGEVLLYIVTGWTVFNLIIAGMALGAVCDQRELRFAPRLPIRRKATVAAGGQTSPAIVENVSHRGLLCLVEDKDMPLAPGDRLTLRVDATGREATHETTVIVRRRAGTSGDKRIGASFEILDEHRFAAVAELMCGAQSRMRDRMAERKGLKVRVLPVWTVEFIGCALRETVRGLKFAFGGKREKAFPPQRSAPEVALRRSGFAAAARISVAAFVGVATLFAADPAGAMGLAEPSTSEPQQTQASLRRLAMPEAGFTLQGEWVRRTVPVHFDENDLMRVDVLTVTATSSAPTLPQATSVDAYLNGTLLGRVRTATNKSETTRLTVPQGLLQAGWNALTFTARHQHRVSCSLDAGYDLWTRIDAASSGFEMLPSAVPAPLSSLPGLLASAQTPRALVLRLWGSESHDSRVLRFAAQVSRMARLGPPAVTAAFDDAVLPGVSLSVGPDDGRGWRSVPGLPGVLAHMVEGELKALRLHAGDGAAADRALAKLDLMASAQAPKGTPEGLAALKLRTVSPLKLGETYTLAALGTHEHVFAGRRFEETVFVDLPADILRTGSESVRLTLTGDYARNLAPGATLRIKVNGAEVTQMPLTATPETTLNAKPFALPLAPFVAGRNRLTIEAELPSSLDGDCPVRSAAVTHGRFLLSGASTLTLPQLGRAGVTPNIAGFFWHGAPYTDDPGPTALFVEPHTEDVASALRVALAVAVNAPRSEAFSLNYRMPEPGEAGVLVSARGETLAPEFTTLLGVPSPKTAWEQIAGAFTPVAKAAVPAVDAQSLVRIGQRSWAGPGRKPIVSAVFDERVPPTLTVVAAKPAALSRAIDGVQELIPFAPRGKTYAYEGASDKTVSASGSELIFRTEPPKLGNVSLVIGQWMSNHTSAYVAMMLVLATILGAVIAVSARSRKIKRHAR